MKIERLYLCSAFMKILNIAGLFWILLFSFSSCKSSEDYKRRSVIITNNAVQDQGVRAPLFFKMPFTALKFKSRGRLLYQYDYPQDTPRPISDKYKYWHRAKWELHTDTLLVYLSENSDVPFLLIGGLDQDTLIPIDISTYPITIYVKQ